MAYKKSSFLDDFELPEITNESIKKQIIKVGVPHNVEKVSSFE